MPQRVDQPARYIAIDAALVLGLMAFGALVRWPELWSIPVFTDEWDEIAVSIAIVRDGARPLTNADAYYGALTSYLMAGFFGLSGITVEAPRLFALTIGTLQIVPTYLLGLELGRAAGLEAGRARWVAGLAGLLLASSGAHILLNSHLAWANSTTPLFTTVAIWLLVRLRRRADLGRSGMTLGLVGVFLGLALQTHILVIAIIVGAGLAALLTIPQVVLSRWSVLGAAGLTLGYGNMVAFNLSTGGETFRHAQAMSAGYAGGKEIGYSEKLADLLLSLLRVFSGALDRRGGDLAFLTDPLIILGMLGALVGVGVLARRGQATPACVLLAVVMILPLVNNRYEPLFSGRYLSPLLPVLFGSLGVTLVLIAGRVRPRAPMLVGALVVTCVLSGYSLWQLHGLYDRLESSGRSNTRVLETLRLIREQALPEDIVYLDNRLARRKLMEAGAGDMERVFRSLLEVSLVPYQVVTIDESWSPAQPGLVILASRENPRSTSAIIQRLGLTRPIEGNAVEMSDGSLFELFRVTTRVRA